MLYAFFKTVRNCFPSRCSLHRAPMQPVVVTCDEPGWLRGVERGPEVRDGPGHGGGGRQWPGNPAGSCCQARLREREKTEGREREGGRGKEVRKKAFKKSAEVKTKKRLAKKKTMNPKHDMHVVTEAGGLCGKINVSWPGEEASTEFPTEPSDWG